MAYVSEVSARTEQFWCPIKHAKRIAYRHSRYNNFLPYGDAKAFKKELEKLREELQNLKDKE
jgi:phosphohistidine phosphatase SixA